MYQDVLQGPQLVQTLYFCSWVLHSTPGSPRHARTKLYHNTPEHKINTTDSHRSTWGEIHTNHVTYIQNWNDIKAFLSLLHGSCIYILLPIILKHTEFWNMCLRNEYKLPTTQWTQFINSTFLLHRLPVKQIMCL